MRWLAGKYVELRKQLQGEVQHIICQLYLLPVRHRFRSQIPHCFLPGIVRPGPHRVNRRHLMRTVLYVLEGQPLRRGLPEALQSIP
jgi:hypothetical protein